MKSKAKKNKTSIVSLRLPTSVIDAYKDSSKRSGVSLNKHLSSILIRKEMNERLKTLTPEESDFIDKIWFWDWLIENLGRQNVEAMMNLTKHLGNLDNQKSQP